MTKNCDFEITPLKPPSPEFKYGWFRYICKNCGKKKIIPIPPPLTAMCAKPKPPRGPCVHRGKTTRLQDCKSCSGIVKIKVYACLVHGECVIGKKLPDLPLCATCDQYQAAEPQEIPGTPSQQTSHPQIFESPQSEVSTEPPSHPA